MFHDERQTVQADGCQWNPGTCLLVWGHVVWSGISQLSAPLGLLFVFLSVGLLGLRYLRDICEAVREKQWMLALGLVFILLVVGVLILV